MHPWQPGTRFPGRRDLGGAGGVTNVATHSLNLLVAFLLAIALVCCGASAHVLPGKQPRILARDGGTRGASSTMAAPSRSPTRVQLTRPKRTSGLQPNVIFGPTDDRTRVNDRTKAPFGGIAQIEVQTAGRISYCTGTVVDSSFVLTAAHCLFGPKVPSRKVHSSVWADSVKITVARLSYEERGFGSFTAKKMLLPRQFVENASSNITLVAAESDYAIIQLNLPLTEEKTKKMTTGTGLAISGVIKTAGYPVVPANKKGLMYQTSCSVSSDGITARGEVKCDTSTGQAGSPVWRTVPRMELLGIVGHDFPNAKMSAVTMYTSTFAAFVSRARNARTIRDLKCQPPCNAKALCVGVGDSTGIQGRCVCRSVFFGDGRTCVSSPCELSSRGGCDPNARCEYVNDVVRCTCNAGFVGTGQQCSRRNPCETNNGGCSPNADCANAGGTAVCTCKASYQGDGRTCSFNPCLVGSGGCSPNADCANAGGTPICTCKASYQGDGRTCTFNPCLVGNGGCSPNADCANAGGTPICTCKASYQGDGRTCSFNPCLVGNGGCSPNADCANAGGTPICTCKASYQGDGRTCSFNPCLVGNGGCSPNADCANAGGTAVCTCKASYQGDGRTCSFNPCLAGNGGCSPNADCANAGGTAVCTCKASYQGDGRTCSFNPCLVGNGGCSPNADCANAGGTAVCTCKASYQGDGRTCSFNPCLVGNGGCSPNADCANAGGTAVCTCKASYQGDGRTCSFNPCLVGSGGCSPNADCANGGGTAVCTCKTSYEGDGRTCTFNPCLTGNGGCSANAVCSNNAGSASCACKVGFVGDGRTCNPVTSTRTATTSTGTITRSQTTSSLTATFTTSRSQTSSTRSATSSSRTETSSSRSKTTSTISTSRTRSTSSRTRTTFDPCHPSVSGCSTDATCENINNGPSCNCLPDFVGDGHTCRPRKVTHCGELFHISDHTERSSTINVVDTDPFKRMAVELDMIHPDFGSLDINLLKTSAGGDSTVNSLSLSDSYGGCGIPYGRTSIGFSDTARDNITTGCVATTAFKPLEPFEWHGYDPRGDWTLSIADRVVSGSGTVLGWCVHFFYGDVDPCPASSLTCGGNASCFDNGGFADCLCDYDFEGDGRTCYEICHSSHPNRDARPCGSDELCDDYGFGCMSRGTPLLFDAYNETYWDKLAMLVRPPGCEDSSCVQDLPATAEPSLRSNNRFGNFIVCVYSTIPEVLAVQFTVWRYGLNYLDIWPPFAYNITAEDCVAGNPGVIEHFVEPTCDGVTCETGYFCLNERCVYSGALLFTLVWDTAANLDLYIMPPDCNRISKDNPYDCNALQYSDEEGFGPELVVWEGDYPRGTYVICIGDNGSGTIYTFAAWINGTSFTEYAGLTETPSFDPSQDCVAGSPNAIVVEVP